MASGESLLDARTTSALLNRIRRESRVLLATGEPEAAREAWQHALAIFTELDAPSAEDVRTLLSAIQVSSSR